MKFFLTGAEGFVGRELVKYILSKGHSVVGLTRRSGGQATGDKEKFRLIRGNLENLSEWEENLKGVDALIHLAARAHIMKEKAQTPLEEFQRINTRASELLYDAAERLQVKRFVYISTVHVNGDHTLDLPFSEESPTQPCSPYARSKYDAEKKIKKMSSNSQTELVIVRPPLIYGPFVRANFLKLLKIIRTGIPLPLGRANSERAMIGLRNFCDLLYVLSTHKNASGETFLACEGGGWSTADLIQESSRFLKSLTINIPVPKAILEFFWAILGKREEILKLTQPLELSSTKLNDKLSWTPPFTQKQELLNTLEWFSTRDT